MTSYVEFVLIAVACNIQSLWCIDMKDRPPNSLWPKAYLSFVPDDIAFLNGTSISITCLAVKADPLMSVTHESFYYPSHMQIYDAEKSRLQLCDQIPRKKRPPEKTCSVNHTYQYPQQRRIMCHVCNGYGRCTTASTDINITDPKPPTLMEEPPRHINVPEGLDLNVTCKSTELPRPAITWYENRDHVTRHEVTLFRGTSTLTFRSITPDVAGRYWCRVNNSLGEVVSMGTNIKVFVRPRFTKNPANQNVSTKTEVILTCEVSGLPLPVIGWIRDGENLGTDTGQHFQVLLGSSSSLSSSHSSLSPPITSSLTTNISSSSSSSLTSSILTSLSSSSSTLLSTLSRLSSSSLFSPSLSSSSLLTSSSLIISTLSSSSSISVSTSTPLLSSPMSLSSSSSSKPNFPSNKSTLSSKNGSSTTFNPSNVTTTTQSLSSVMPTRVPKRPFSGSILQNGTQSTLRIQSATIEDNGKYYCYATNALGNANSTMASLTVYDPERKPRFEIIPRNTSTPLGTNITLKCSATGNPTPNITWYMNNSLVNENNQVSMMMTHQITSLLFIYTVSRDDEALYVCKASNKLGVINSTAFVEVIDLLPDDKITQRSSQKQVGLWSAVGVSLFLLFVVMVILLVFIIRRLRKSHAQGHDISIAMTDQNGETEKLPDTEVLDDLVYLNLMGIDRDWELPRDRLQRTNDKLGSGCFGNVYSGVYTRKDGKEMLVAVKMLKVTATDEDRDDLMAELEILKQVGRHPNIVSLVGACTKDGPICVVIELIEGGNLYELLRKTRIPYEKQSGYENIRSSLTDRDLVKIARDTAKGMSHLHKKQCIHRDLAARNVLIGKGLVARIADFGLARNVPSDGLYVKTTGGKVPWKWMAPEALRGLFTKQSDIWSFGVLLWEIATLGDIPYLNVTQVVSLYKILVDGYRLEKPLKCDDLLYELMMACWSVESASRPSFDEIKNILQDILNQNRRIYINLVAMDLEDEMEAQA